MCGKKADFSKLIGFHRKVCRSEFISELKLDNLVGLRCMYVVLRDLGFKIWEVLNRDILIDQHFAHTIYLCLLGFVSASENMAGISKIFVL